MSIETRVSPRAPKLWPWPKPEKPPQGAVEFNYNSQDQTVLSPSTTILQGVTEGPGIDGHVVIHENRPKPEAGKYVYSSQDPRFHQACAFASVEKAIELWTEAIGRHLPWSFSSAGRLEIHADRGDNANAYYSVGEGSLNFFHFTDPVTQKVVFTGDSGEVASHEAGHAILDGLRPQYLQAWSPDPAAFHESFGDITAMLVSLRDERVLDRLLQETGGDLRKPNLVANMGEELGMGINHLKGKNATGGDYVRTALNTFTWKPTKDLPYNPPADQLGWEAHNYSRLFTGAIYDVLCGLKEAHQAGGQEPRSAIRSAGLELARLVGGLAETAPQGDFVYKDLALALLESDRRFNQGKAGELLQKVFEDRKILEPQAALMEPQWRQNGEVRPHQLILQGMEFGPFQGAEVSNPVDASRPVRSPQAQDQTLRAHMLDLIQAGRILYTAPGQVISPKDLLDPQGEPYSGVVRWLDGKMSIERVQITS